FILAGVLVIAGLIMGSVFSDEFIEFGTGGGRSAIEIGFIVRYLFLAMAAFCLINALVYYAQIAKNQITVFENGVSGYGIIPKGTAPRSFDFPIFKTPRFNITSFSAKFEQISSVSIFDGQAVNISISGITYIILASNPDEVVGEINKRHKTSGR
ncbi:MAG: hypothetical protein FWB71_02770, partial [Defluviitaleaceae bacterium]|nr:hypothetical protein [Defluviitaleaceae bacterium]